MKLSFNGQGMHSDITVMDQADFDEEIQATSQTVKNPYVIGTVYRPKVMTTTTGKSDAETLKAAENARANELRNLQLTIETDRWDVNGKIIMPGSIISVINPNVYLFKKGEWFVEEIDLKGIPEAQTAIYKCVLPAVYDGSTPKYYMQGINLH